MRLIFLDETWATTNMARSHGRALCGQRLVAPVPYGHFGTRRPSSAVCGIAWLMAPLVLDGAINGAAFLAYVEQMLCPTLHPGDIVICDNLASHKVSGVREAIEACGASPLYLPPCSPDLTCSGQPQSGKLFQHIRQAANRVHPARTALPTRAGL